MPKELIYLDNAATTPVATEVAETVLECLTVDYGNPASVHQLGVSAEARVKKARRQLGAALGDADADAGTLYWTSGGTEGDAMGIMGGARAHARLGKKIVHSAVEHSAIRESARLLADEGFEIRIAPVGADGIVDVDAFAEACKGAAAAALMLVNNEIGTIQPVAEAIRAARAVNPDIHIHCDAVQALGKLRVDVNELDVDTLAVAAHKLHGPKGVGALWLRKRSRVRPLWAGGGQQGGCRAGTLNVPSIAGMGHAAELSMTGFDERNARFTQFAETVLAAAEASGVEFVINGDPTRKAPHILSLAFRGVPAEPLLHTMESRGVLVSAGSACAERERKPSAVLQAIGLGPDFGTLRVSFGRQTSAEDVATASEALKDALRSFS
jgi:cysteine desulfurase